VLDDEPQYVHDHDFMADIPDPAPPHDDVMLPIADRVEKPSPDKKKEIPLSQDNKASEDLNKTKSTGDKASEEVQKVVLPPLEPPESSQPEAPAIPVQDSLHKIGEKEALPSDNEKHDTLHDQDIHADDEDIDETKEPLQKGG